MNKYRAKAEKLAKQLARRTQVTNKMQEAGSKLNAQLVTLRQDYKNLERSAAILMEDVRKARNELRTLKAACPWLFGVLTKIAKLRK